MCLHLGFQPILNAMLRSSIDSSAAFKINAPKTFQYVVNKQNWARDARMQIAMSEKAAPNLIDECPRTLDRDWPLWDSHAVSNLFNLVANNKALYY